MNHTAVKKLTLSAMFLALGLLLPFLTGQIQQFGNMLLPMHLPVLLCGLLCGWKYGLVVGTATPLLRSLLFFMPPFFPTAVAMAFELATYGCMVGVFLLLSGRRLRHPLAKVYAALIPAMLLGRIVWGGVMTVLMGLGKVSFSFQIFLTSAFVTALPGIVLQLVLIPALVLLLQRTGLWEAE